MDFLIRSPHETYIDVEVPFALTDSEEIYNNNIKKYGSTWYYANNTITYKFNTLGYRMKELSEVDYDNYYAFFGCSFTVGIGLKLEDTFAYKISQRANVDYINASIGGSSVDFVYYNFINLMNDAPKKPKVVFINWPGIYRNFYWCSETYPQFMLPRNIETGHWEQTYKDFVVMEQQVFKRFDIIRKTIQLVCDLANIPLFEMCTYQDDQIEVFTNRYPTIITDIPVTDYAYENKEHWHINYARDIGKTKDNIIAHPGFMHQDEIVNRFFEVIK